VTFTNNGAGQGGAVYSGSDMSFGENLIVTFTGNSVMSYDAAMYATKFHGHSMVTFILLVMEEVLLEQFLCEQYSLTTL